MSLDALLEYEVSASSVLWAAALGLLVWLWSNRAKTAPGVPSPPTGWVPWFGHFSSVQVWAPRMYDAILEISRDMGRTWTFAIPFFPPYVVLVSPDCVEHVLRTNFDNYAKGPLMFEMFHEVAGHGIFNADGQSWYTQRKTASTMFSHRILRDDMFPVFAEHSEIVSELLEGAVAGAGPGGAPVTDLQDVFFRFTMDSICAIAFGDRVDTLRCDVPFASYFDAAQAVVKERFFTPRPLWRLKRLLGIGAEGRFTECVRQIDAMAEKIVQRRKMSSTAALGRNPDLLSRFIAHYRTAGTDITDRDLRDIITNYLLAGRDTTACLCTWAMHELMRHPDELRRVLDEMRGAGIPVPSRRTDGEGGDFAPVTHEAVGRLEYLEALLYEVLRLHPSVPIDGKFALRDDVLPDGTPVPAGALVSYQPYGICRMPDLYPDPELFLPSRFLGDKPSPYAYPVFNAGPRICLGKHVAFLEAKTLLATILPRFDFTPADDNNSAYGISIVLPKRDGLRVRVSPAAGGR